MNAYLTGRENVTFILSLHIRDDKYDHFSSDIFSYIVKRFVQRLNKGKYTTVAFDYDGTLSAKDRKSRYTNQLCDDIKDALQRLLENGVQIIIATGRGKSVGDSFKNSFDQKSWPQIKVGYYNGGCPLTLGDEDKLKTWKKKPFDSELKVLSDELQRRLPENCIQYELTARNLQLSIEEVSSDSDAELLYNTCREIVWDKQLKGIRVWRSSHSMDIVVYHEVSKLNVIEKPDTTLCIGDYGSVEGNDYELLTSRASLSVDKVSKNADSCWNIAPSGVYGLDATLYYLSRLIAKDGVIKCKFSV